MGRSRLERLLETLGEENLPPRLPTPPQSDTEDGADHAKHFDGDVYKSQQYMDLPHANPGFVFGNDKLAPARAPLNPRPVVQPPPLVSDTDEPFTFDTEKGATAPPGTKFCPFIPVTQFCYRFVPNRWVQPLATAFFDAEKIYKRNWTLYYISSDYTGTVAFVTEGQVRSLLEEINTSFPDAEIDIPDWALEEGLLVDFSDLPFTYQPRLAGNCASRGQYRSCLYTLDREPKMSIPTDGDYSVEAFKKKMGAVADISKKKKKATNTRRHQEALMSRQEMVRQSLRGQRYLGLHPKTDHDALIPNLATLELSPVDPNLPAPHPFDEEPIFISIDCEAWESPPRMVTEVGVATLDTRDLKGIPPGENGTGWHKCVRGRHFRVIEYKDCVNYQWVQGCPDHFQFGPSSEWVSKDSLASVLATCFTEPYSKRSSKDEEFPPLGWKPAPASVPAEQRKLILVGHDVGQDIEYLRQVGFNVTSRSTFLDTIDTVNMYRTYNQDPNARSLGAILANLDLAGWYLHNAGNDAVYTIHAMLAMCVKTAAERGTGQIEKRVDEHHEKKTSEVVEGAKERAKEDREGWDAADEDGGVGVPPSEAGVEQAKRKAAARGPSRLYTIGGAPLDV